MIRTDHLARRLHLEVSQRPRIFTDAMTAFSTVEFDPHGRGRELPLPRGERRCSQCCPSALATILSPGDSTQPRATPDASDPAGRYPLARRACSHLADAETNLIPCMETTREACPSTGATPHTSNTRHERRVPKYCAAWARPATPPAGVKRVEWTHAGSSHARTCDRTLDQGSRAAADVLASGSQFLSVWPTRQMSRAPRP